MMFQPSVPPPRMPSSHVPTSHVSLPHGSLSQAPLIPMAAHPVPPSAGTRSASEAWQGPPVAAPARGVLQRHLLMALCCHDEAARLEQLGDAEGALRQQRLMGVFLHNALDHLPP